MANDTANLQYGTGGGTNATMAELAQRYFDTDFNATPYYPANAGSLAYWIITEVFNLPFEGDPAGDYLPAYDINNRDAYNMVQLSLAVELKNDRIYECYAGGDGNVRFYNIGESTADLGTLYYSVETTTFNLPCDNVLVYGYDPPPSRTIINTQSLFTIGNGEDYNITPRPDGKSDGPWYYVYGDMFPECGNFKEGWIEYNKIDWGDSKTLSELYNKYNWEELIAYAYNIQVPFFKSGSSDVKFMQTSTRIWSLGQGYAGESAVSYGGASYDISDAFENQLWITDKADPSAKCLVPADPTHFINLNFTDHEKFVGIKDIIIYGFKLDHIYFYTAKVDDPDPTPYVKLNTMIPSVIKLRRGTDYIVNSNETTGLIKLSFFCDVKSKYKKFFGKKNAFKFKIHPSVVNLNETTTIDPASPVEGTLKDGVTAANLTAIYDEGVVFPLNEGQSGYVIKGMYVLAEWDNPCIYFKDDRDVVTLSNLETVSIDVLPIVKRDPPAPVGHNGTLVDLTDTIPDDDPLTYELWNFTSEYQQILDSLEKGDLKITLPFLNEDETVEMSGFIKEMKDSQYNAPETVYVCGPDANPELGDITPDGSVVSDITYSYQDSSQYTITVQSGPAWRDIGSGWNMSMNMSKTERLTLEGIVMQAAPNNAEFIVYCEKLGAMPCLNLTKDVIANGDKVQVTVYNNPQGEN